MNAFLAKMLSSLNALFAIAIIAISAITAGEAASSYGSSIPFAFGAIIGAIAGLIFASLVCGTIAFLVLIERHLSEIAAATRQPRS